MVDNIPFAIVALFLSVINARPALPTVVVSFPTSVTVFPKTRITGPTAATSNAILITVSCCFLFKELNLSARFWIYCVAFFTYGVSLSPKFIAMLSTVDFKIVNAPFRLFCETSYILPHAFFPSVILLLSFFQSLSEAFTIASNPDIPVLPASDAAYCAFCASVNPLNF